MKKILTTIGVVAALIGATALMADNQIEIGSSPVRSTVPYSVYSSYVMSTITNVGAIHWVEYPSTFGTQIPYDVINYGISSNATTGLFYGIGYDPFYVTSYGIPSLGNASQPFGAYLTNSTLIGATLYKTNGTTAPPLPPTSGGYLWVSNTTLFWVTATKTNAVAGP